MGQTYNFIHIPKNAGSSMLGVIRKNNTLKNFNYHPHWVDTDTLDHPQVIILRDPLDRFASAFYYRLKVDPKNDVLKNKLTDPNKLAEYLYDEDGDAIEFISEPRHYVGNKFSGWNYVFVPQHYWISNPDYVLLYEHLDSDMRTLFKLTSNEGVVFPRINMSKRSEFSFSRKAYDYLFGTYEKDFQEKNRYTSLSKKYGI